MILPLNKRYRINSDSLSYTLEELKVAEKGENKGEEYWVIVGYYARLEDAINGALQREIRMSNAQGAEEIKQVIAEFRKDVEEALKPLSIKISQ